MDTDRRLPGVGWQQCPDPHGARRARRNHEARHRGAELLGSPILPGHPRSTPRGRHWEPGIRLRSDSTVTAAVEYPAGTFTRITFGGATSGTIPDKSVLVSDEVAVAIPKGAHFFVRMHLVNANGVPDTYYTTTTSAVNNGPNDAATFGTNVADQTMGGTVAATVAGVVVFPSAIVGPSNAPAVCLHADSRGAGIHPAPASLDNGNSLIAVGEVFPYINLEMPGETAAQAVASYAVRASLEQFCTADVMAYGSTTSTAAPRRRHWRPASTP